MLNDFFWNLDFDFRTIFDVYYTRNSEKYI